MTPLPLTFSFFRRYRPQGWFALFGTLLLLLGSVAGPSATAQPAPASTQSKFAMWDNNPSEVTGYFWNGSQWVTSIRYRYLDDAAASKETEYVDLWTGTAWLNSTEGVTTYNASRQPTEVVQRTNVGGTYLNSTRTIYLYTDGLLTDVINRTWDPIGGWVTIGRTNTTYVDGLPTEDRVYTYNGVTEIPTTFVLNDYDDSRRILGETTYDWDGVILSVVSATGYDYTSEFSPVAAITEQEFDTPEAPNTWINVSRTNFTYDAQERATQIDFFEWSGSTWTPVNRTVQTFSGPYLMESRTDERTGTTWTPQFRFTFDYGAIPVELASFSGARTRTGVELSWATASETNNAGFDVQRRGGTEDSFTSLGFVAGRGTTVEQVSYRFVDKATTGLYGDVTYRLKQVDLDGTVSYSAPVVVHLGQPEVLRFTDLGPNPMRSSSVVQYEVATAGPVRLTLYNLLGQRVWTLADGPHTPGVGTAVVPAHRLPSGTYFLRLEDGRTMRTEQIVVVR